jgi:hypothetical protein
METYVEPTRRASEGSEPFDRVSRRLIARVAENAAKRVVVQTISWLKNLEAQLSEGSAGTHLKSVWEELCVQCQGEESFFWDEYKETVTIDLVARVEQLDDYIQLALWLQTQPGFEWTLSDAADADSPPIDPTDTAEYLWGEYILPRAEAFSSSRIRSFLDERAID